MKRKTDDEGAQGPIAVPITIGETSSFPPRGSEYDPPRSPSDQDVSTNPKPRFGLFDRFVRRSSHKSRLYRAWVELDHLVDSLADLYRDQKEAYDVFDGLGLVPASESVTRERNQARADYVRRSARFWAVRARIIQVLADMESMRDESTDTLIDLLQEAYGNSAQGSRPSPARVQELGVALRRERAVLVGRSWSATDQ